MQTICYQNLNPAASGGIEKEVTLDTLSPYHLAACLNCGVMSNSSVQRLKDLAAFLENYKDAQGNQVELCADGSVCDGGIIQAAYYYIAEAGITPLSCDPAPFASPSASPDAQYKCESNVSCLYVGATQSSQDVRSLSVADLATTVENVKREVMANGPLTGGFSVYESFMTFFDDPANATKVYTQEPSADEGPVGGHAVVIAGWGTQDGVDYWLIRNSWGHQWGDNGYFRMKIGMNIPDGGNIEASCFAVMMSSQPVNSNYQPMNCECKATVC